MNLIKMKMDILMNKNLLTLCLNHLYIDLLFFKFEIFKNLKDNNIFQSIFIMLIFKIGSLSRQFYIFKGTLFFILVLIIYF